jgi:hypothetical protein
MSSPEFEIINTVGGETRARLSLGMTLFFRGQDFNGRLSSVLDAAVKLVAPHAVWFRSSGMQRNQASGETVLNATFSKLISRAQAHKNAALVIDSGETLDGIGPWGLRFSYEPELSGHLLGYLQLSLPATDAAGSAALLEETIKEWLSTGCFLHGTAGFAVNYDHGDLDPARNVAMRAFCERFSGVALADLVTESEALMESIKGAQWLTFISHRLLEKDVEAAEALSALRNVTPIGNGILVRACESPILGDRHRGESIVAYQSINAALAPWLVDTLFPMPGFPDEQSVQNWLEKSRAPA